MSIYSATSYLSGFELYSTLTAICMHSSKARIHWLVLYCIMRGNSISGDSCVYVESSVRGAFPEQRFQNDSKAE
jgi:hypothetical protein